MGTEAALAELFNRFDGLADQAETAINNVNDHVLVTSHNVTVGPGKDFETLAGALGHIRQKARGAVTITIDDGVHDFPGTLFSQFGGTSALTIRSAGGDPANCVIRQLGDGANKSSLRFANWPLVQISNVTVRSAATRRYVGSTAIALRATNLHLNNVVIDGPYEVAIRPEAGSTVTANGGENGAVVVTGAARGILIDDAAVSVSISGGGLRYSSGADAADNYKVQLYQADGSPGPNQETRPVFARGPCRVVLSGLSIILQATYGLAARNSAAVVANGVTIDQVWRGTLSIDQGVIEATGATVQNFDEYAFVTNRGGQVLCNSAIADRGDNTGGTAFYAGDGGYISAENAVTRNVDRGFVAETGAILRAPGTAALAENVNTLYSHPTSGTVSASGALMIHS